MQRVEISEMPSTVPASPEQKAEVQRQQAEAEELLLELPSTLFWPWQKMRERKYKKILKQYFPIASSKKINHVARVLAKG